MAAPWFEDEIANALARKLPGLCVEVVAEIDSTSSELMRRARDGSRAPVLLVAERQTAGRGRLGRSWQSAQDAQQPASLTFSLGLPLAPRDWSGLSLAVGVSVAESLDPSNAVGLALKWPNDLWLGECKLGGILIETALLQPDAPERYLVIGIGINIGPREAAGLSTAPAWLQQWRPQATPAEVLREIALPLVANVQLFDERGFVPFAPRFAARDALRGREVQLSDGTEGRCEGVGWGGELLVQTASGMKTITSAEVSVRPAPSTR
ncbi:BirA family transcriptional regulator, biotin operon repressor / biotin-[acetyl-CoA-carboxylase] ligase [Variovorax sp. HW608]|uniref:biotin--[acetyl-CoA-carboxylase] ligase n=1 Tax=Variovorax sp. HW608 TaxID=1034889 RepID=UPI000820175F|nr:biotin--[acetyl-CoA-carboxylase] ligase [Variovorax sp. HW608]SCK62088.1 BirA family transcriptional regulator, biotin operon repressor / biotin-[acetyl-CoA-carboxylase] ligase [Variovorax sp. HW608]